MGSRRGRVACGSPCRDPALPPSALGAHAAGARNAIDERRIHPCGAASTSMRSAASLPQCPPSPPAAAAPGSPETALPRGSCLHARTASAAMDGSANCRAEKGVRSISHSHEVAMLAALCTIGRSPLRPRTGEREHDEEHTDQDHACCERTCRQWPVDTPTSTKAYASALCNLTTLPHADITLRSSSLEAP